MPITWLLVLKDTYGIVYRGAMRSSGTKMILECRKVHGLNVSKMISQTSHGYGYHAPTLSFLLHMYMMIEPTTKARVWQNWIISLMSC